MMRLGLWIGVLFFATFAGANGAPLSQAQILQIDRIAAQTLAKQHIAGMEIGVGRAGRPLYLHGYGLRDRSQHLAVTANTVFPIGSITKQFTSTAVMLLAQRGKVDLDAEVARYVPTAPHGREITVRELLDQTSGLPDYLEDKALLGTIMAGTVAPQSVPSLVALVAGKPLHFRPGSKFEYSNTNYALAGLIVARVSGMPYSRFLQRAIFEPQDLSAIQYLRTSVPAGRDVARGYNYAGGKFTLIPRFSMDWANAAGALASNAANLIRWDHAYFSGAIIPVAAVRAATTPPAHVTMLPSKDRANNLGIGYAFGWVQGRAEGRQLIWHNGGLPGARAMNLTFPRDELEVIVLTNATSASPEETALKIARAIYNLRR